MRSLLLLFCAALQEPGPPPLQTRSDAQITVSGSVDLDYLQRNGTLNEASHWVPGGLPAGSPLADGDNRIVPKIILDLDVQLNPVWEARIRLANHRIHYDTSSVPEQTKSLGGDGTPFFIERAWIRGKEFLGEGITLSIGAMDYSIEPTGAASIFLDAGRAESPWGELPDSTAPPFPTAGTNTVPQTRRDELQPTGLLVNFREGDFHADFLAFPAMVEGGMAAADEALYGARVAFPMDDSSIHLEAILTLMAGGTDLDGSGVRDQRLYTFGIGNRWRFDCPTGMTLEIGTEGYWQFGNAGRLAGETLRAEGRAARFRARVSYGEVWMEAGYVYLSGDQTGLDDKEQRFLSYENNDEFLIVESNEFGLDVDNNLRSWRWAFGGTLIEASTMPPLLAELRVGGFRFDRSVPRPPDPFPGTVARSHDLGTEIDGALRIPFSEAMTLELVAGILFDAEALESFTFEQENSAIAGRLGLRILF